MLTKLKLRILFVEILVDVLFYDPSLIESFFIKKY